MNGDANIQLTVGQNIICSRFSFREDKFKRSEVLVRHSQVRDISIDLFQRVSNHQIDLRSKCTLLTIELLSFLELFKKEFGAYPEKPIGRWNENGLSNLKSNPTTDFYGLVRSIRDGLAHPVIIGSGLVHKNMEVSRKLCIQFIAMRGEDSTVDYGQALSMEDKANDFVFGCGNLRLSIVGQIFPILNTTFPQISGDEYMPPKISFEGLPPGLKTG